MKKKPIGLLLAAAGAAVVLGAAHVATSTDYVGANATTDAEFSANYEKIDTVEELSAVAEAGRKVILGNLETEYDGFMINDLSLSLNGFSGVSNNTGSYSIDPSEWLQFTPIISDSGDTFQLQSVTNGQYFSHTIGSNSISLTNDSDVLYTFKSGMTATSNTNVELSADGVLYWDDALDTNNTNSTYKFGACCYNRFGGNGNPYYIGIRFYRCGKNVTEFTSLQKNYAPVFVYALPADTEPVVNLSTREVTIYSGIGGSLATTSVTASVQNIDGEVTYEWAKEDAADAITVTPDGASAVITVADGFEGTGTATVTVTAKAGDVSASATITVNILAPLTVAEALQSSKGDMVLVAGYVVSDNIYEEDNWRTAFEIADANANINTDPEISDDLGYINGVNTIQLYDTSRDDNALVAKGQYVVVYGEIYIHNGSIFELNSGYEVVAAEYSVERLTDYILGAETGNQCNYKYEIAKAHFLGMSSEDQTAFSTAGEGNVLKARERYEAWASAVGDINPYEVTAGAWNGNFNNDTVTYTVIGVGSAMIVAVAGVAIYLAIRRRKANRA